MVVSSHLGTKERAPTLLARFWPSILRPKRLLKPFSVKKCRVTKGNCAKFTVTVRAERYSFECHPEGGVEDSATACNAASQVIVLSRK